jgi:hypothetical protein
LACVDVKPRGCGAPPRTSLGHDRAGRGRADEGETRGDQPADECEGDADEPIAVGRLRDSARHPDHGRDEARGDLRARRERLAEALGRRALELEAIGQVGGEVAPVDAVNPGPA